MTRHERYLAEQARLQAERLRLAELQRLRDDNINTTL